MKKTSKKEIELFEKVNAMLNFFFFFPKGFDIQLVIFGFGEFFKIDVAFTLFILVIVLVFFCFLNLLLSFEL